MSPRRSPIHNMLVAHLSKVPTAPYNQVKNIVPLARVCAQHAVPQWSACVVMLMEY